MALVKDFIKKVYKVWRFLTNTCIQCIILIRITLDRVREFVTNNPTVYMGTHTPQGVEDLEAKRIIDLNNPVETIPVGDITFKTKIGKYVCLVCGYVYDPNEHDGVLFEGLPDDWVCPRCKRSKDKFNAT